MDHVKPFFAETADEFLRMLVPTEGRYRRLYSREGLYFRGQANSEWPLLPRALRDETLLGVEGRSPKPGRSNEEQIELEAKLLFAFAERANRSGLFVPDNTILLLQRYESVARYFGDRNVQWPPDELLPIASLAQHSGLPTRLLDWTRNGYVAAYFAATEAASWLFEKHAHSRKDATHLCVFVIHNSLFELGELANQRPSRISPVVTSYATNPNMRAQNGLFLFDRPSKLNLSDSLDLRPWDKIMHEDAGWLGEPTQDDSLGMLDKICLPIGEATRLLRLLSFHGVDAASVFPTYDGVVSAIEERRFWESSEDFKARTDR